MMSIIISEYLDKIANKSVLGHRCYISVSVESSQLTIIVIYLFMHMTLDVSSYLDLNLTELIDIHI